MTKYSKLTAAVTGALIATTIALFAVGGSPAHAAEHSRSARTTASDTTVSYRMPKIPAFGSYYLPKVDCPPDYPYLLNHNYSTFAFSLMPGVEIGDHQEGLGVVALDPTTVPHQERSAWGWLYTGISGTRDPFLNSATNWRTDAAAFTIVLHCTSDAAQAYWDPGL